MGLGGFELSELQAQQSHRPGMEAYGPQMQVLIVAQNRLLADESRGLGAAPQ
jgi:hypothetical protein